MQDILPYLSTNTSCGHFSTINQHEFYHDAKGVILKIFGMCMHRRHVHAQEACACTGGMCMHRRHVHAQEECSRLAFSTCCAP